jgi:hypothetical protein
MLPFRWEQACISANNTSLRILLPNIISPAAIAGAEFKDVCRILQRRVMQRRTSVLTEDFVVGFQLP